MERLERLKRLRSAWRITWFLVMGLSVGAFSAQCYYLIDDYFKYDTSVFVDISLRQYLNFPAITICNKNMAKYGKIKNNPHWRVYAGEKSSGNSDTTESPVLRQKRQQPPPPPPSQPPSDPLSPPPPSQPPSDPLSPPPSQPPSQQPPGQPSQPPLPGPQQPGPNQPVRACTNASDLQCVVELLGQDAQYVRQQLLITGIERDLSFEKKTEVSYTFNELVIQCLWNGASCNESYFQKNWIPGAGNCYTFNYDYEKPLVTSIPGPLNGLTLMLYAQTKSYLPYLTESNGLRLVVHSPRDIPLPMEMGFDIPQYTQTSLGLRVTDVIRQPPPFVTHCYSEDNDVDHKKNAFTEWYPHAEYSPRVCQATCLQRNLMSTCKCANPQIPSTGPAYEDLTSLEEREDVQFCNFLNASDWECSNEVRTKLANHHDSCICPPKCKEVIYTAMTSSAAWPTTAFTEYIQPVINEALGKDDDDTSHINDVCKVNIYFEDLTLQKIHHSEAYTWTSLASDLGGLLGLWLGLSVLALYEMLEILVEKLRIASRVNLGKGKARSVGRSRAGFPIRQHRQLPPNI